MGESFLSPALSYLGEEREKSQSVRLVPPLIQWPWGRGEGGRLIRTNSYLALLNKSASLPGFYSTQEKCKITVAP